MGPEHAPDLRPHPVDDARVSEGMARLDTQVLIVGGGPVGLLGARLLGRRGVSAVVAEKHLERLEAPKAHALNPRSLEICAAAGLPMAQLLARATPTEDGRYVRMVENLAKPDIGVIAYERQDEAVREVTPYPLINIEQPRFEEILEASLQTLAPVDYRRGLEWMSAIQVSDAVISTLKDRRTGETLTLRSRYLIACDGAGSSVRDSVGIAMDGPDALGAFMMIHFEANLRPRLAERPAILYFLFGPGPNGVLIAYDIEKTWVLMHPVAPDVPVAAFDVAACRAAVERAVGGPLDDLTIKGVRAWKMSAQVARRYREGQVFLAGDAGHRFPPTGGLGLNTGVGDIDNLAWKIAAIEAGWAGPDLLDTYERERRLIAQTNMGQSLANAFRIRALFDALGYGGAQTVDDAVFRERLSDPAARPAIDQAVAQQKDHFDSLRLQLGFAYGEALRADDTLPISAFTPKCVPGARLPHVVLSDGRSSLDLVHTDHVTLLLGADVAHPAVLDRPGAPPLRLVVEGTDFRTAGPPLTERLGLSSAGGLLVRPDGHVFAVMPADAAAELASALDALVAYLGQDLRGAD